MALGVLVLHLATNGQYDFHRDSLYYMDSARHPAWGYVDYPPVTPTIARLSLWLFGPSVWGLRLWPTLCGAAMVVICYLIARELGAGRFGRLLAAAGAATSLVLLGANWLFQTVTFDQVVWLSALYLLARLVRTGDKRLWVAIGATLGVGLETKYTVIGLILGVVAGTLLTRERRHLATPWPWIGIALMLLIFLPNLLWQVANDWPSVEYTLNHKASQSADFAPATFLVEQLALIGPVAIPIWIAGLYWLLSNSRRRVLGIAAAVPFVIFLFAGKSYYVGPLHPFLIACGACAIERWTVERRPWLRRAVPIALTLQAAVLLPIALPLLPESVMASSPLAGARKDFADTVGWRDLVHLVAVVYGGLPEADRRGAIILTDNYGEAGAIDTYGPALGLPHAYSGELSYYYWKPPSLDGPVITVGMDRDVLLTLFATCVQAGTVTNGYHLENEEDRRPVYICSGPRYPLDEFWPRLKAFR